MNLLSINDVNFSNKNPMFSPDGKHLYFSSNMTWGIWTIRYYTEAEIKDDGSLGKAPENLGQKINTEGQEAFPFITSEKMLYFSSDGHLGLGVRYILFKKC